jgi:hypothetical protein
MEFFDMESVFLAAGLVLVAFGWLAMEPLAIDPLGCGLLCMESWAKAGATCIRAAVATHKMSFFSGAALDCVLPVYLSPDSASGYNRAVFNGHDTSASAFS